MRDAPDLSDKYDADEVKRLEAPDWMYEALKLNPRYNLWGPGEDYMPAPDKNRNGGWNSSVLLPTWKEIELNWQLDDLNECVNFHFEIDRKTEKCKTCDGSGYNEETRALSESFYKGWGEEITQGEVNALIREKRFPPGTTEEEVNLGQSKNFGAKYFHDAVNQHILVRERATRRGVFGHCKACNKHGHIFVEKAPRLCFVAWIIHPRKGAARGVVVERIEEHEVPKVCKWLAEAAKRNADRFARAVNAANFGKR